MDFKLKSGRKLKLKDKQVSLEREAVKDAKQLQFALAAGS